ncbi:hypothetical protein [Myxacorys almedinensis]|uniref:FHA domain containing protein n=1 Tax=Myxacorys almedinensis A TaxID=2690445 RepID=A0A8J7Z050_9CYAN|nr:hypothetical protein [Myxacorys almedinensis]NDJ17802.1 hypothetical protein [Myxacorys almedinensis A]
MFGITRWRKTTRTLSLSLVLAMTVSLWGCGGSAPATVPPEAISTGRNAGKTAPNAKPAPTKVSGKLSEVSPPEVLGQLKEALDRYQPQVTIATPKSNELLNDNTVSVKLQVKDLPVFKDETLGLGPHIHLFLDDQPYQAVYDVSKPFVLTDLAPGTHTLRAFASRPWHESFKNEGAYAQTTFHIFTKTPNNSPDTNQPLLTYSRPQGKYGAEPIMLDFYLTNAPLHFVAQEDEKDEIADWRIKATVNGNSFILDRWQPIYLKGFESGKNWVQLEYIDENGNAIQNVYNNTARLFTYEPGGNDALSKLVRGDLSFDAARGIVEQNYTPSQPSPKPEPSQSPTPKPSPSPEPKPAPTVPVVPIVPLPEVREKPPAEPQKAPVIDLKEKEKEELPTVTPTPESKSGNTPKAGFFNRFRRGAEKPAPSGTPSPVSREAPNPVTSDEEATPSEAKPESKTPEIPKIIKAKESESQKIEVREPKSTVPAVKAPDVKVPEVEAPPVIPPMPVVPSIKEAPKGGFFNRFRGIPKPTLSPTPAPRALPSPAGAIETKEPDTVAPESESPRDPVLERYDRNVKSTQSAPKGVPTPSPEPTEKFEDLKATEPKPSGRSTRRLKQKGSSEQVKTVEPPKAIERAVPNPSATKTPGSAPVPGKASSPVEDLEATETRLPEFAAPMPAPKTAPKAGFFNRFRPASAPKIAPSLTPKVEVPNLVPSPIPSPQDPLQILEKKETADNNPTKPNAAVRSRDNLVDRLLKSPEPTPPAPKIEKNSAPDRVLNKPSERPSTSVQPGVQSGVQPTTQPRIQPTANPFGNQAPSSREERPSKGSAPTPNAEPHVEPPTAQPEKGEPSDTSGFQPQTELERRLGMPLKASPLTPVP